MTNGTTTLNPSINALRDTARHEAGHAVAHIRLNIDQECATILPGIGTLGAVTAEADPWNAEQAKAQVIALCSGYAARVAAGNTKHRASAGCRSDFELAQNHIKFWGLNALDVWKANAVDLMRNPENIRAVDLISQRLMELGTIDAQDMEILVDVADGGTSWAEFVEWVQGRASSGSSTE
jgi:ATP-dependent Zn protease